MSDSSPSQTGATTVGGSRSTGRSIAAVVCVVLAVLLTTPAAVAFWGQRTLNDSQRYLDTVGPLVDSPEVQDAIATTVIDAIEAQVDVEAILNDVFAGVITDRPRLERLVGPLSGAVNGLIERQVREFIASDAFADIWVRVNTRAQQTLVRVLQGEDTGAVSLQGDQVVLDVSEVIDQVKARLVARGLTIVENVPIPEVDSRSCCWSAAGEAGAHDLRVREPRGQVADLGGGRCTWPRCCSPTSTADDGDHRGGAAANAPAGGLGAVGRPPAVHQSAGRHGVPARRARCSTTRCWPTLSAAGRYLPGWA